MNVSQPANPKRKLRWYQFSLRSLFALTLVVAIASSWLAVKIRQAKKQQEAVAALLKLDGIVEYDYELDENGLTKKGAKPPAPAWLRMVLGDEFFRNVSSVYLSGKKIGDSDLEHLKGMKQLRHLFVISTKISDKGLEHIEKMTQLQNLDLSYNNITDDGLQHIKELKQLKRLFLSGTKITDSGLKNLEGMDMLQRIHLEKTKITDSGLEHFAKIKQLQSLDLESTKVTDAGVAKLKKTSPNLQIVH